MGSYDIYVKGRLKYKGTHFENTNVTRFYPTYGYNNSYSGSRYNRNYNSYRSYSGSYGSSRERQLTQWTANREAAHAGRTTIWEHFYLGMVDKK